MAEFLDSYLFHWTAGRAIWLGGHTLSFDARCAGIHAGFALATLYQVVAGWQRWALPRPAVLAAIALFLLPMLAHVGYMFLAPSPPPVNDWRFATGLLFGGALSAILVPALAVLWNRAGEGGAATLRHFAPILLLLAGAFLLTRWNSYFSFVVLQTLSVAGCIALFAVLLAGIWRAPRSLAVVVVVLFGGCATGPSQPAPLGVCENISATAPVDDWAEERFCLTRPFACVRAWELKEQSESWLKTLVGTRWASDEMRYGRADAARHAHLMCLVTRELGAEFARGVGEAHENDSEYLVFLRKASPGNPCCEKVQDLYNNEVGIKLAAEPGSCEEVVLASMHLLRHSMCPSRTGGEYPP